MDFLFGGSALNSGNHGVSILLPKMYGLVVLVAVASVFLLLWLGNMVIRARNLYKIEPPTVYSPTNVKFNCIQRAHENTLEGYSTFLILLLFGGLEMPVLSSIAGVIWICGKVSYAKGYSTGDPAKRMKGAYAYIGLLILLIATIKFALHLIVL